MNRRKTVLPLVLATAALSLLALYLPGEALGATVMIDDESMTATPGEPRHSDTIDVSVDIIFVDAQPVEDGVILEYSLCTENACELPSTRVMTDNGDGSYSTTVGPFPGKNAMDEDYIDVRLLVKVTYTPVSGGEEATVQGEQMELYFNTTSVDDDELDDDDSGDDDDDDSPFGLEIVFAGMVLSTAYIAYRKRN